jgi:hypothetical protein
MGMNRRDLEDAREHGLLHAEQVEPLWLFLSERAAQQPSFRAAHILYYLGGLLAIGAMSLFMTLGWEMFGGWGLFALGVGYGILALKVADHFLAKALRIPAGIMAALVVVLVPLAVYGLQRALGYDFLHAGYRDYHVYIDWTWLTLELATLVAAAVMLWRYRLPFLTLPLAVTLWYLSMDLAAFLLQGEGFASPDWSGSWEFRRWFSLWFGLAMLLLGLWIDLRRRGRDDYAFWIHLFGLIAFWGSLSAMDTGSELGKLAYCGINLLLIVVGAVLGRRTYAVFGGLGVAGYLGHLAWRVFKDSIAFPFALTLLGFALIGLGIRWQRNEAAIRARLMALLPDGLRGAFEQR